MKVYFDHQIFLTQQVGGISRYFYSLKKALIENKLCSVDSWAFIYRNTYVDRDNGLFFIVKTGNRQLDNVLSSSTILRTFRVLDEIFSVQRFKKPDCDIIHVTDYESAYLRPANIKKPIVVTVHDMIPELFPHLFNDSVIRNKIRKDTLKMADHLICISESTKRDLKAIYGFPDDKISMIHHGPPDYMVKIREYAYIDGETNTEQNYLLYVGDRHADYKNFWRMMDHLLPVLKTGTGLKLLCVGGEFSTTETNNIARLNLTGAVRSIRAHDDELYSIYEKAACFIYPSLYEGFGFPLLEAMKAGCPILASNASSLPEVGGNGALYFDPHNFDGFAKQLNMILNNNAVVYKLKQNQISHLKNFSWATTAAQTCNVYKSLV